MTDLNTTLMMTAAAFFTAAISGTIGMGGGVTLIAIMAVILPPQIVVPIHGVVQLASNATRIVAFLKHVDWRIVKWFVPLCVLGVLIATMVWQGDKMTWFKPVIGLFIIAFLLYRKFKPTLRTLPLWTYAPLGLVVGFQGIFIGATGPFIAPFFLRDDLEKEEIVGTKAACQAFLHLLKLPAFMSLGFAYDAHLSLLVPCIVAVFLGTFFGKAVLSKLPNRAFVILFQVVLSAAALHLILSSLFTR